MISYFIKSFLPHELRQKLKRRLFATHDMASRLLNLKRAGFNSTGAIDGGAYRGEWSELYWNVWGDSDCVLVEPQISSKSHIMKILKDRPKSKLVSCALGEANGKVTFQIEGTNSRIASLESSECFGRNIISVPMTTIDEIVADLSFKPNLLKLDLQGNEITALNGSKNSLPHFEVVISEVSILRIGDVPIFEEFDSYMRSKGYRLYDFIPSYCRPLDGALWQADVFYVNTNSKLFSSLQWS